MKDLSINVTIPPSWSLIKEVQHSVKLYSDQLHLTDSQVEDFIMIASELTENAVKYGSEKKSNQHLSFKMKQLGNYIKISVSNSVYNRTNLNNITNTINKIHRSRSPRKLYINRMKEILEAPFTEKSMLGLFRIAYEGSCTININLKENILTVTAFRQIDNSGVYNV